MATNTNEWFSEIKPDVTGCPDPTILTAIVAAARDLCERTLIWKDTLTAISVVADQNNYTLSSSDGDIISVSNVKYKQNGLDNDQYKKLEPLASEVEDLTKSYAWEYQESTSPSGFYVDKDNVLYLVPIPTEASTSGLLVKVYLKPSEGSTTLPDFLYDDRKDLVTIGAKARLMAMVGKPWENLPLAGDFNRMFIAGCNDLVWLRFKGKANRPLQVRLNSRRFA